MKCICENMNKCGIDMHNAIHKTIDYKGFTLLEDYGQWWLDYEGKSVEIFYCPFCGRKLNHWSWADDRRSENFEEFLNNK